MSSWLTFAGTRFFATLVWPTGGGGKITPQRISAPMIPRKIIPTATPMMFSGSSNSMKLFFSLCDASGSQKSKMAAHKQEYLYLSLYINVADKITTAISMFSRSRNSMKLFLILSNANESQKSKMAAHKYRKYSYLSLYSVYYVAAQF